jgi:hypothetical protein
MMMSMGRAAVGLMLVGVAGCDALGVCDVPEYFEGVVVNSVDDAEDLRDEAELEGLFVCGVEDLLALDLPNLVNVETRIEVHRCPRLSRISMPSLRSGELLRMVDLPALQEINFEALENLDVSPQGRSLVIDGARTLITIRFPVLQRASSGIDIVNTAAETLELPVLAETSFLGVGSTFASSVSLPELVRAPWVQVSGGVTDVSIPKLTTVEVLTLIGFGLNRIELPNLERVVKNEIGGQATIIVKGRDMRISLGKLREIDGWLFVSTDVASDLSWLGALERVGGSLELNPGPSSVLSGLRSLAEVGGGLRISPAVRGVDFPALRRADGGIFIQPSDAAPGFPDLALLSFPALERAGGVVLDHTVISTTAVGFPNLREITADATFTSSVLRPDGFVPALAHVGGELLIEDNTGDAIDFPQIATVGKLSSRRNAAARIAFPALTTVADKLAVFEHPNLSMLEFPALSGVGGNLVIANNPVLPACEVEVIVSRVAGAIGGEVATTGNDEGATCVP